MFKDQQQRSMMWETTVRKTQQQQQLPSGRRRGCGIFPAASVVPSGDGDFSGNSSGGASPTTPSKSSDELYPEEKTYHAERLLPNGDFYTGLWCGNLPHGAGKYLWTDGCMYEGDWIQGKTTGVGKFSWPSGATYEGEFKTGFMDGTGTYTGAGGETYRGTWCMNLKHGRGKKSYANGDYYDGEWRGGVQDGQGRYIWKNCNEYSGGWKGGTIHGRGRLSWANGNEYSGEFEDGIPCGKGQFRWADTSKYVGIWCRDGTVKKGVFFPSPAAASEKDLREAFDMDMGEWQVCAGETVSILPSQKTVDWSWMESEFLHKQAAWRSAKATDGGSGCGTRRRDSSNSLLGGGLEALCLWDPQERDGSGDGTAVRESNASGEMKWAPREVKKQGETISKGHKNYELMLNLQLGIRHSVGKPAPATTFDLKASAFDPKEKVWTKFPPEGTKQTPPHQSCEFKWKDYCPVVFRTLRKLFKIDAADYMLSICGNDALRELSSPGKSGSFFYLTHDDRYMIKTVKKSEVKVLLRMLPAYYNHVRAFDNTLVTKFFGLHCVKLTGATQKKVRFVIMGNLFCSEYPIHRRFDLKGSSHGRTTDKPEDQIDETTTLKDLDLNFMFRLQKSWFLEFQRQVDRDCEFLEQERIMDYSLLVGLHFRDNATATTGDRSSAEISDYGSASEATPRLSRTDLDQFLCDPIRWAAIRLGVNMPARVEQTQRSEGGSPLLGETFDVVLFFGIIDILQDYDISKKLEHAYKSIQYDPTSISAVDPKQYSRRFRDFIFKVFRDDP